MRGTRQESVLNLVLLIVYVNDLPDKLQRDALPFAIVVMLVYADFENLEKKLQYTWDRALT